jgi:hypothetical protein
VIAGGECRGVAPEGGRASESGAPPRLQMSGANCVHLFAWARTWLVCAFRRFACLFFAGGDSIWCAVVGRTRTHRSRENDSACVIASVSEAIQLACAGSWIASSLSLLAMTTALIRLRAVKRNGGGGPSAGWWRGHAASTLATRLTPLPPPCGRSPSPLRGAGCVYNAATAATSTNKSSRTRRSTTRSVFGGKAPLGNRRGSSRAR